MSARLPRVPLDHYATPPWVVELLVDALDLGPSWSVLDPSCGDGRLLATCVRRGATSAHGLELDAGRARAARATLASALPRADYSVAQCDALGSTWPAADVLVGNPPYTHAQEFAERAAVWAAQHSRPAALLLRLAFLESAKRAPFHREHPADVLVLSRRPAFRSDTGGTDMAAYAWFVWGPGHGGRWRLLSRHH